MPSHLVIIPTYNEKENVLKIINAVFGLAMPFHVLIIDDGSPDGTADLVKIHQKSYTDRLFIEERKGKLGLGTAYIHGFNWGLARNYDFIYEMDADFSHNPNDLIRLFEKCQNEGFDMSVGSRYVKGGKLENWPLGRILLSYGASVYVRLITFMNIKDPTAGFVCYSNRVLGNIDLEKIRFIGYAFQIEMKYAAKTLGFSIGEVPITFKDRVEGISKMNSSIIKEAIIGVVQLRWNSFFNSYKKVASELSKT